MSCSYRVRFRRLLIDMRKRWYPDLSYKFSERQTTSSAQQQLELLCIQWSTEIIALHLIAAVSAQEI
jgi:hypothetical protein